MLLKDELMYHENLGIAKTPLNGLIMMPENEMTEHNDEPSMHGMQWIYILPLLATWARGML